MVEIKGNRLYSSRGVFAGVGDRVRLHKNGVKRVTESSVYLTVNSNQNADDVTIERLYSDGTMDCLYGTAGKFSIFVSSIDDFVVLSEQKKQRS